MIYDERSYHLDDLAQVVTQATNRLKPVRHKFDSIIVTGMSGVIVGAPVALRLRKPLVVLRKASDDSHHGPNMIINQQRLSGGHTLFLDDFVSRGDTRSRVFEKVTEQRGTVVGTYLYRDDGLLEWTA